MKKYFYIKCIWLTAIIIIICYLCWNILKKGTTKIKVQEIVNNVDITQGTELINSVDYETKKTSENLTDLNVLRKKYYIVPSTTAMTKELFNVNEFENTDLKIHNKNNGAKILIFHTHSMERFADSGSDISEGIVGAGEKLCNILQEKYGVECIHIKQSFDIVGGKTKIMGAYERMEPAIRQAIKENPEVEMVIDMHRDGVADDVKLVTNINGKPTAQIMFFNGLCYINENGKFKPTEGLYNPYLKTNLALSYNLKKNADELYPNFAKKIYLNAYRYSLHMMPKSTLIEVGAQTNTKEEINNAIELLADVIAKTVL